MNCFYASAFDTPLGTGIVVASFQGVCRVLLPPVTLNNPVLTGLFPSVYHASALTDAAALQLNGYFKDVAIPFNIAVDLSDCTPFRRRVYEVVAGIPAGIVYSYQEVAQALGMPHGARAIGAAMAANPVPLIVPCHRVVGSRGQLVGFSAEGGVTIKRYLLAMEGIAFTARGECLKPSVINSEKHAKF